MVVRVSSLPVRVKMAALLLALPHVLVGLSAGPIPPAAFKTVVVDGAERGHAGSFISK